MSKLRPMEKRGGVNCAPSITFERHEPKTFKAEELCKFPFRANIVPLCDGKTRRSAAASRRATRRRS